jgi:3-deoxy-manno-octulosonate cytidylyltransferase (CMP-KDO synthetase)
MISTKFKIVIPARFGSSCLPGKPLLDIAGKPMIWHVYKQACKTNIDNQDIVIATDNQEIFDCASGFGARVVMTKESHESGTDRLAEVVTKLDWHDDDIIVNLQGDDPLITPDVIQLTATTLANNAQAGMATLACNLDNEAQLHDPNCVKLVCDQANRAMYFSRAAIPFARDGVNSALFDSVESPWLRHIGMYAYRVKTLKQLSQLPVILLEELEKLEQLRALWHGISIQVACVAKAPGDGVDTADDLNRVREILLNAQ